MSTAAKTEQSSRSAQDEGVEKGRRLRITELFHSIQGESTWAGWPCYFVRLTGCNLRCVWCDSEYTFHGGEWMSFDDIFAELDSMPDCRLVEITGGEPLLQAPVNDFMRLLIEQGYTVLLETGGSLDIGPVPHAVHKIVDLKPPASGESERNLWSNLQRLAPHDEVKCVIVNRSDYEWAREKVREYNLIDRIAAVNFSPAFGVLHPRQLTEWILADGLQIRVNLQQHKFVWDPDTKGV